MPSNQLQYWPGRVGSGNQPHSTPPYTYKHNQSIYNGSSTHFPTKSSWTDWWTNGWTDGQSLIKQSLFRDLKYLWPADDRQTNIESGLLRYTHTTWDGSSSATTPESVNPQPIYKVDGDNDFRSRFRFCTFIFANRGLPIYSFIYRF